MGQRERLGYKLLHHRSTTELGAVAAKETAECFRLPRWSHRDRLLDDQFSPEQPARKTSIITTLGTYGNWEYALAAALILGEEYHSKGLEEMTRGFSSRPSRASLRERFTQLLIERGHTLTLPQVEEMVEKDIRGEAYGVARNGHLTFYFTETGDPSNPVMVGYIWESPRGSVWNAGFNGFSGVGSDNRLLLVPNLDPTILD